MFELDIPGFTSLDIRYLVLDYNGTLGLDGRLIPGAADLIGQLSETFDIHVLTADTRGRCREHLSGLPVSVSILTKRPEDVAKRDYVEKLGTEHTACIGNGANDRLMIEAAILGIAVVGEECAAGATVRTADIVAPGIIQALGLFAQPLRLLATLRV